VNNKKWRKWCKFVSLFLFNNTYGLPVLTMDTKRPNQIFYVWLFDLQTICAKWGLEMWLFPNNDIGIFFLDMSHSLTKKAIWKLRSKKLRKWWMFLLPFYLITLMAYLCSQWTPNVQIKYFISDWSIYRKFVLNRAWKRDSLQIMIFVYVFSTWGIVALNTRFETWITRNDVNGVNLFHLSYLITFMAYLSSQWTPKVRIKYFNFDWSIYRLFVPHTA
jgi:hypothetical protein